MRIRLTLFPSNNKFSLPVNYNYFLTGLIYRFIRNSSCDYSRFLHDEGYRQPDSKKGFKLFTYSMLMGSSPFVRDGMIGFRGDHIKWMISSPVDEFVQHLVNGVFAEGQEIMIGPEGSGQRFIIGRVETLPVPNINETMSFTCLSPVTVSKVEEKRTVPCNSKRSSEFQWNNLEQPETSWNKKLKCHYLRPWEDGFSEAVKNNLVKKFRLIHDREPEDSSFTMKINSEYMNKKNGRITKKIRFKGTDIIGFMAPFEVSGSPELIKTGYEAGFGEKGSMGFGMVNIMNCSI